LRLDVELLLRARLVFTFDDEVGFGQSMLDVALFDEEGFKDIVFAPDDLLFRERIRDGEDRGEWFVLDVNGATCFFEQIFIGMREKNGGFFGMVHYAIGEAGLVFDEQRDTICARDILGGDYGEFIPRNPFAEAD
jgi:hypothetical protein